MSSKISFHGGAGTVTGSRHLLETGKTKVLVDAGLFQGLKKLRKLNWQPTLFKPAEISHLMLTHTHIDHAGYLPRLVRDGLNCPVHCTPATRDLAKLLLMDSAHIQEEDARYANKKKYSKHKPALPLYTSDDAEAAIALMRPVQYAQWLDLGPGVRGRFLNMGHILGSAMVQIKVDTPDGEKCVVFSGDVGRYDVPLHSDPDPMPECDALVIESTYGNREHEHEPVADQIEKSVAPTLARGGTVLIPAFAVGRAQSITLMLRELINEGRLPDVPIHIDSPMAVDATRLYTKYLQDLSLDADLVEDGRSRLFPNNVHFHRSVHESKALNRMDGPRIVISASGMLTAGRVLHHLKRLLPDKKNLIMLVGYQASGTRGRAMMEGAKTVRMHGEDVPVVAQFQPLGGLSAHADRAELLRWVNSAGVAPKQIFITHGERGSAEAFAQLLHEQVGSQCLVPAQGDSHRVFSL